MENAKDFNTMEDLNLFFDNFIKQGEVVKEKEVVNGFKIKLKVLNTEELLSAETVMYSAKNIPVDVVQKVRGASILSLAIISINGIPVEKEDAEKSENFQRRSNLYRQLLSLPAYVVQKSYEFYLEAVKEQNRIYSDVKEVEKKLKIFRNAIW